MRIGVDLGGTKIEAIALAEDGGVCDRRRKPTPKRRARRRSRPKSASRPCARARRRDAAARSR